MCSMSHHVIECYEHIVFLQTNMQYTNNILLFSQSVLSRRNGDRSATITFPAAERSRPADRELLRTVDEDSWENTACCLAFWTQSPSVDSMLITSSGYFYSPLPSITAFHPPPRLQLWKGFWKRFHSSNCPLKSSLVVCTRHLRS